MKKISSNHRGLLKNQGEAQFSTGLPLQFNRFLTQILTVAKDIEKSRQIMVLFNPIFSQFQEFIGPDSVRGSVQKFSNVSTYLFQINEFNNLILHFP